MTDSKTSARAAAELAHQIFVDAEWKWFIPATSTSTGPEYRVPTMDEIEENFVNLEGRLIADPSVRCAAIGRLQVERNGQEEEDGFTYSIHNPLVVGDSLGSLRYTLGWERTTTDTP